MKPILVDALGINMGGAKTLLNYLVNCLLEKNVEFELIKDVRCPELDNEKSVKKVYIMKSTTWNHFRFHFQHRNDYRKVFSFENCPPLFPMSCPVHTYFHNVNIAKIPDEFPLSWKVKNFLKRCYYSFFSPNTDSWIIQTPNTEACLRKTMPTRGKAIYQLPFYDIPDRIRQVAKETENRNDYILVGGYTGTRGHDELVNAWSILGQKGFKGILHLTVDFSDSFCSTIDKAVADGAKIVNHGIVPFTQIPELYAKCKATVYPSVNESLGLGIIEALEAGCDVIGADLPYIYSVCKPSGVFEKRTPESIADAVDKYERSHKKSELLCENKIEELINLIS